MRIAAYVTSTIASIPEVIAGARSGDVAIEGVFSHPSVGVDVHLDVAPDGEHLDRAFALPPPQGQVVDEEREQPAMQRAPRGLRRSCVCVSVCAPAASPSL